MECKTLIIKNMEPTIFIPGLNTDTVPCRLEKTQIKVKEAGKKVVS
jgi:hypothetical protein